LAAVLAADVVRYSRLMGGASDSDVSAFASARKAAMASSSLRRFERWLFASSPHRGPRAVEAWLSAYPSSRSRRTASNRVI